ncbi:hypothetical protein [Desertibacillus haloalkaliphilus]|nr:hypothetical protein [Desertibacillus haloalkaliphilus]MBU8908054.1 hypothetical protein [Desertibacillus haloalkaliphilus]
MNTTLAKFMSVAMTAVVIVSLLFGAAYNAVKDKTNEHEDSLREMQILED